MQYGDKRKYECDGCGAVTYFKGEPEDRPHPNCPKKGTYRDIELRMKCPGCKNIIKRESTDSQWKCKACGHREFV
ncbi:MAG: hypothetical protein ACTSSE_08660 [Candidatus Thorarchaeota archaeon]